MLDFVDVDQVDTKVKNVELVVEAEPHYARRSVHIARSLQILSGEVLEVVAADHEFQVLNVVVD